MSDPTESIHAASPPEPEASWELTGIDRAIQFLVLRGTWLFDEALDVDRLKQGLSQLLVDYPHLSGRMEGLDRVRFVDEGVPFATASRHELTLRRLVDDHALAHGLAAPLRMGPVKKGRIAPMAVRVTHLADGSVLSVTCAHACMDGSSFYSFVRSWGLATSGRPWPEPVLDSSLMPRREPRPRAEVKADALARGWRSLRLLRMIPVSVHLLTGRMNRRGPPIRLGPEALEVLRERAVRDAGDTPLSTNDLLTAHLSLCFPRLFGHRPPTRCTWLIVYDGRERIRGIPPHYVGNASYSVAGPTYTLADPLGKLAAMVHHTLDPVLARPSEHSTDQIALAMELMEVGLFLSHFDITEMHARRPTLVYQNNFSRLPIYDVDFGTAAHPVRPVRVIPHDLADPVLFWPTPPGEGGVEVYLTGHAAMRLERLAPDDPWWARVRGEEA